ncbi:MAG: sugar phosphate isomerase/epimerase, partial [Sphingobacteriaceae bacterium]
MHIKFLAPSWGNILPWDKFFDRAKQDGFDGVEIGLPPDISQAELDLIQELCNKRGLDIVAQHYSTYEADFNQHYDTYSKWFDMIAGYPCLRINTQTGKDYFTFEQNKALIDVTVAHQTKYGIPVSHETHRNKFAFAAHITKEYLQKIDYLRLTLDLSHWVNVAESYLEDQQ